MQFHMSSIGLNLIAFVILSSVLWQEMGHLEAIGTALLAVSIWVLDEIRFPFPFIAHDDYGGDGNDIDRMG